VRFGADAHTQAHFATNAHTNAGAANSNAGATDANASAADTYPTTTSGDHETTSERAPGTQYAIRDRR